MKETVDLRSVLVTLWRRKWVVVVPTVLAAATAIIVTLPRFMRPVYQSSSALKVEFPQALSPGLSSLVNNPSMPEQIARLHSQIQDNEFLKRVIDLTGMRDDRSIRDWAVKSQKRYPDLTFDELVDLKLIEYLRRQISVGQGTRSAAGNILRVSVQDYEPARARLLVQNITSGIIEASRAEQIRDAQSTGRFSDTQIQEYRGKLKAAEDALESYRRQLLRQFGEPTLVNASNAGQAEVLRQNAALDLDSQEAELVTAGAALRQAGVPLDRLESAVRGRDAASRVREARELEEGYVRQTVLDAGSGKAPAQSAVTISRRVEEAVSRAREELGAAIPAAAAAPVDAYLHALIRRDLARTRVSAYDRLLAEHRTRISAAPESDLQLKRLEQEVESYRQLYNAFVMQMASSQISEAFGAFTSGEKISILEPAQHPLSPVWPKRGQIIILSILAGLALGTAGVFLLEHHDPSFRDLRDVERSLGLRVLATIPRMDAIGRLSRTPRRADSSPLRAAQSERAIDQFLSDSPGYQEFRKLVLGLYRAGGADPRSIMVTSSRRAEGKSTTAACLALTLAREFPAERVVLVDLDTRRSTLGSFFAASRSAAPGACVLNERRWTGEPLRETNEPNLRLLLPADERSPRSDAVTVETIRWLLGELARRVDRIVIDSPPNLPVPDALVIGPEVDCVLLVLKAGETPRETARRGLELQRQFRDNVVGIVMNNSGEVMPYYYDYRHYGYGSSYGHVKQG